jgi:hypothetical protein
MDKVQKYASTNTSTPSSEPTEVTYIKAGFTRMLSILSLTPDTPYKISSDDTCVRSKALTVFNRSNTRIVGSNPARCMDVCPRYSVLYCPV